MTCLVNILVGTRGTEAVDAELLVGVALPAHGAHHLNRQGGDAVGKDGQAVLLVLEVKGLEAGQGDDTGLEVVVLLEDLDGIEGNGNLGTSGDEGDVGTLNLVQDVATLGSLLDGRALELGKVLASQSNDAGGLLGGQGDVVSTAGLVTVGRSPDESVGESTEVGKSLNRLVGRTILTETDRVVGGDPDGADARQSRQTDGTSSVRDEVQEGTGVGQDGAVGSETVEDGTHGVLTDAISNISAAVVAETGRLGLEVDGILPPGQVGASQIGGTTKQLGDGLVDLLENSLGQLSRGDGGVGGAVDGEVLLPALGEVASLSSSEVSGLGRELLLVLGEELVPLLLSGGTLGRVLAIEVVDLLGDDEALLGVEAELLLELLDVVSLEGRAVDTVGALVQGAETNGGLELDKGGLVSDGLGLLDGSLNGLEVVVTVLDGEDLPTVGLVSLGDILSKGDGSVTVNGDLVVVPDGDQVAELEVASERAGLARDTLHQAAIAEEDVGVVVDEVETGLVEDSSGVSLGNGQTNSVGDALTKRASGNLNTRGVMGLGVTGSPAVDRLEQR